MTLTKQDFTEQEARELTDSIRVQMENLWEAVIEAYQRNAHKVLGYPSWDDYCRSEFGSDRIRIPKGERPEVVEALRGAGMSNRAIAAATGVNEITVRRDLATATFVAPEAHAHTHATRAEAEAHAAELKAHASAMVDHAVKALNLAGAFVSGSLVEGVTAFEAASVINSCVPLLASFTVDDYEFQLDPPLDRLTKDGLALYEHISKERL